MYDYNFSCSTKLHKRRPKQCLSGFLHSRVKGSPQKDNQELRGGKKKEELTTFNNLFCL